MLRCVAIGILLLGSPTLGQQPPATRVSGRVIDQATAAPVANARVMLLPERRLPTGFPTQATTDADGGFVFEGIPAGRYAVDVRKTGIVTSSGAAERQEFVLAPGEALEDLTIRVLKSGAIEGRLFDAYGEPVVDALVQAVVPGEDAAIPPPIDERIPMVAGQSRRHVRTNDLGAYRIFGLVPGNYHVVVTPAAQFGVDRPLAGTVLRTTYYPGAPDAASAQALSVGSGQTVGADFTLLSSATYRVWGTVTSENGTPVAGATVLLRDDQTQGGNNSLAWAGQAQSDAAGQFVIADVPTGNYYATATIGASSATEGRRMADPIAVRVLDADVPGLMIIVR
jgi:protocatechuate 3,4-dioxygenase beta subunit